MEYDSGIGAFRWLQQLSPRGLIGQIAGTKDFQGYWVITISGYRYLAHRLAWFYCYGEWPYPQIDHINCDKLDNRIGNLRKATGSQNRANRGVLSNNKLGLKGVCKNHYGYQASIEKQIRGKRQSVYLGTFATAELAHCAYISAAKKIHGQYAKAN